MDQFYSLDIARAAVDFLKEMDPTGLMLSSLVPQLELLEMDNESMTSFPPHEEINI